MSQVKPWSVVKNIISVQYCLGICNIFLYNDIDLDLDEKLYYNILAKEDYEGIDMVVYARSSSLWSRTR